MEPEQGAYLVDILEHIQLLAITQNMDSPRGRDYSSSWAKQKPPNCVFILRILVDFLYSDTLVLERWYPLHLFSKTGKGWMLSCISSRQTQFFIAKTGMRWSLFIKVLYNWKSQPQQNG